MVSVFIAQNDDRDQLIVARLTGTAQRHAPRREPTEQAWREPTVQDSAAAVAELREIAGCRRDLLAQVAGLLIGFYAGTAEEPRARTAAGYCRVAGADQDLIPRWIAAGKRRAACARPDAGPRSLAS